MRLKDKKAIIFDLDGTLVDSMSHFANIAADSIFINYGLSKDFARELYLKTSGVPFEYQMEKIFPDHNKNFETVELFESTKKQTMLTHPLMRGAKETLTFLKEKGFIICISSNNYTYLIESYIEQHPLPVDLILGYGDGMEKGSSHLNFIMQEFRLEKNALLFIGDSVKDFELAKINQIDFIGKIGTCNEKQFNNVDSSVTLIKELTELQGLLF